MQFLGCFRNAPAWTQSNEDGRAACGPMYVPGAVPGHATAAQCELEGSERSEVPVPGWLWVPG